MHSSLDPNLTSFPVCKIYVHYDIICVGFEWKLLGAIFESNRSSCFGLRNPVPCQLACVSLAPKILEPRRRQLGVPDRVLNVAVAQVSLQRTSIVPLVGKRITTGVP
jgi:hypothetical protein